MSAGHTVKNIEQPAPPGTGAGRAPAIPRTALAVALLLVGINMRPAIVALSPLLDEIERAGSLSNSTAGVLTTLPLVCFGAFAPLAPRLVRRHGMERTLVGVLLLLLAGVAVRLVPGIAPLFGGTFLVGTAVAVANVVVTAMIKRDFHHRVGLLSGLHTTMLLGGAALAAGLTVPAEHALALSWRPALAIWGAVALVATAVWVPTLRRRPTRPVAAAPGTAATGSVWRSRVAWNVTLFYAFQSIVFYTTTSWMPTLFISRGSSRDHAGWLLSVCLVCAFVTAVLVPVLVERTGRRGPLTVMGGALCAVACVGLLAAPASLFVLWAALLGLGLGGMVSLGISDMSRRARDVHQAGQLSAMAQCVGYLFAALGPVLFGVSRDVTGGWTAGLVVVAALTVPLTWAGIASGRPGTVV